MADFAPNFTARYKLRYSTVGLTHTMQWRIARGAGVTGLNNMILKVAAFLNVFVVQRYTDWTALSATYAPEDSDIFLPAAVPTVAAGTAVIPANPKSESILSVGFVGRSNLGQKARLFVYGMAMGPVPTEPTADDFRLTAAEAAVVGSGVTILNNGSPNIVASDDAVVGWYSYANLKFNDYWLRQIRG
jgi:hypothetical protein